MLSIGEYFDKQLTVDLFDPFDFSAVTTNVSLSLNSFNYPVNYLAAN